MFDFELEVLDKETNEPVQVSISLVDQNTGEQEDLGNTDKLLTELESGKKHTISLNAEGYENTVLENYICDVGNNTIQGIYTHQSTLGGIIKFNYETFKTIIYNYYIFFIYRKL